MVASKLIPPYLRIVAEIRRRIEDGELAPGDRVPSTRQIAKEWDVALATATKALNTLRQEGIVQAQPRVGTVVAPPRRPPRGRRPRPTPAPEHELTRARIVRTAIDIADSEGLDGLSMRGIAARLGAATMSPYRYVNSKDDLVLLMADAVLGELSYPPEPPRRWRARLELGARSLWELHRAHPWLAQIGPLTRPLMLPNLMTYSEWMLSALDGHGLDPTTMLNLNVLIYSYVQGIAVHLERETQAEDATGLTEDQWLDTQAPTLEAIVTSGDYPTFTRVIDSLGHAGYDLHLDELFEIGLTSMLDGLALITDR
ncbi:GntR family transcriptional regulator [Streptomyces platensis]|uniref:GntR family transcriptional regulator n=1 Tax=Streptomyces platensis TaxID=58346 RepID=A0AAE6NER7_STRPT|nr:TetR/AcrR family transcriptional regulator C-terminal domain-containing protein [Streptomyces platensis]OSY45839.1 Tetracycline repressor protein class A [Streptomyces platensis]QEV51382.1 GntR family transcriptional regulator [Streptomyces platensis]